MALAHRGRASEALERKARSQLESRSTPGIQMVSPNPCKEIITKSAAAVSGWHWPLTTFIHPGGDCGSLEEPAKLKQHPRRRKSANARLRSPSHNPAFSRRRHGRLVHQAGQIRPREAHGALRPGHPVLPSVQNPTKVARGGEWPVVRSCGRSLIQLSTIADMDLLSTWLLSTEGSDFLNVRWAKGRAGAVASTPAEQQRAAGIHLSPRKQGPGSVWNHLVPAPGDERASCAMSNIRSTLHRRNMVGHNLWQSHFGVDEHPFATYVDVHQRNRDLTHSHIFSVTSLVPRPQNLVAAEHIWKRHNHLPVKPDRHWLSAPACLIRGLGVYGFRGLGV